MRIGNVEAKRSEKKTGWIDIPGTNSKLSVTIICGGEGKTTFIIGNLKNGKSTGTQTALELSQELQPVDMDGTIVIVNITDDETSSIDDKIYNVIVNELLEKADYFIELHSANSTEELSTYVSYMNTSNATVCGTSLRMALSVAVPYIVELKKEKKTSYNYIDVVEVPSICLNRGWGNLLNKSEIEQNKDDVKRVLAFLYKKEMNVKKAYSAHNLIHEVIYENAPVQGNWYPFKHAGEKIVSGELLGEIRDAFEKSCFKYIASNNGVLLYQSQAIYVQKNSPIITYGVL